MADATHIEVSVVLAEPRGQRAVRLHLPPGATAGDALAHAGVLDGRRDLDPATLGLAIYGKVVAPGRILESGDRLEVLRPLIHEPRSRRRQLAREGKAMGKSERKD